MDVLLVALFSIPLQKKISIRIRINIVQPRLLELLILLELFACNLGLCSGTQWAMASQNVFVRRSLLTQTPINWRICNTCTRRPKRS